MRYFYRGPKGDGPQQVGWPNHSAIIDDGRVLIADNEACRVIVLNSHLKLERVLLTDEQLNGGKPQRLCYNLQCGTLFVGMSDGQINAHQIREPQLRGLRL